MQRKTKLTQLAIAGLLLASTGPVEANMHEHVDLHGTYLAGGCGADCAAESESKDKKEEKKEDEVKGDKKVDPKKAETTDKTVKLAQVDRYNSNRSGMTSPVYKENYRSQTFDDRPQIVPEYKALMGMDREYNTVTDYDYNRASVRTTTSSATLTEAQLFGMLTQQGRAIYLSLDPEAKSLAIQLASEDSYRDKNLAVREAQRRMNDRRGIQYR